MKEDFSSEGRSRTLQRTVCVEGGYPVRRRAQTQAEEGGAGKLGSTQCLKVLKWKLGLKEDPDCSV